MRLRLFLGMTAVIALVIGLTLVLNEYLDLGGDGGDQVVGGPDGSLPDSTDGSPTVPGDEPTVVPGPGQVHIAGSVTAVQLDGAVLDPREVPTPLTVTSDRGFGNGGELTGVTVDGAPAAIVWDGGRPFVLSSGAGLVLDPVVVDLGPEGLRLVLGGAAHGLVPGTYRLDTPVAVGTAGIATPRDSVTFDAVAGSLFEARGDSGIALAPEVAHRFTGPGLVHLEGALELTDADGTRSAASFDVAQAAFELTLTPDGTGGWTVAGVVDETGAG